MSVNILILGNEEKLKIFRFLKHYHMNIDYLDTYTNQKLSIYDMVITSSKYLESIRNIEIELILNIMEDEECSNRKNLINLNMNLGDDIIKEFINYEKWIFYYNSLAKSKVKFIYDLFSTCQEYNKIKSKDIKFHKI